MFYGLVNVLASTRSVHEEFLAHDSADRGTVVCSSIGDSHEGLFPLTGTCTETMPVYLTPGNEQNQHVMLPEAAKKVRYLRSDFKRRMEADGKNMSPEERCASSQGSYFFVRSS